MIVVEPPKTAAELEAMACDCERRANECDVDDMPHAARGYRRRAWWYRRRAAALADGKGAA